MKVMEFMRRFLQHVLPTGFMKVRYYGFLHPGCSVNLDQIRVAIEVCLGEKAITVKLTITKYVQSCPDCGENLHMFALFCPICSDQKDLGSTRSDHGFYLTGCFLKTGRDACILSEKSPNQELLRSSKIVKKQ